MPSSRQSGAITLLTSVIILMMTTILVIAISKTTLMEQRISGNEIRSRQAAEAAEAGLNFGLAYLTQTSMPTLPTGSTPSAIAENATVPSGADKDNNDSADVIGLTTLATGTKYRVRFCDPVEALTAVSCPDAPDSVVTCTAAPAVSLKVPRVVACGWSDDGLGRSIVSQNVGTIPALPTNITNPLTAKGAVNLTGSPQVLNYYNNLTVWSGGSLDSIGATGKTYIRNPLVAPPAGNTAPPDVPQGNNCNQINATDGNYVCGTDGTSGTGTDVIDGDPTLSNLTGAELFTNYFGADIDTYKSDVATMLIDGNNASDVASLDGVKDQAIVITAPDVSTNGLDIGTRDRPVILIIQGNWTNNGSGTIYGVVYVTGDMICAGTPTIYGGVVVAGNVSGSGTVTVIYDPLATSNAGKHAGRPGAIPGSWRNWK